MSGEEKGKLEAKNEDAELKRNLTELEERMSGEEKGNIEAKNEDAGLKRKLTELEERTSEEIEGKQEAVKEQADMIKKLTELEERMSGEEKGKLEAKNEHTELKRKLTELEQWMSEEAKGKLETKNEFVELKMKLTELEIQHRETLKKLKEIETLMSHGKAEQLEAGKENEELTTRRTGPEKLMTTVDAGKFEIKKEFLEQIKILIKFEEQKEEMEKIIKETTKKLREYEQAKSEWRNKLIQIYHNTVLKVPAMPLLPDETCDFSQIYVRPIIVSEVKTENRLTYEKNINSMSEIFPKKGASLKSIYVVGDAGTGKSSFCKYLVNCWCMAHSEVHGEDDEFQGVTEMKKFEFLFIISLRHNQKVDSIREMLNNQYDIDILDTLLKKESAKVIILLDGLDEWSSEGRTYNQFQTIGLPVQDAHKDYTIVTTSRPWKIHTLKIRDTEIAQMLKLKGFDDKSEKELIKRTVLVIDSGKAESKYINDFRERLKEKSLRSFKQVPIMLQQMICLWFDGKLDSTSRCVIYTEMLELFFTWNDDKVIELCSGDKEGSQTVELPEYLADKEICKLNCHLIYEMSRLAYKTLFKCNKNKSLTFGIGVFRKLKISEEIIKSCLQLGILTKESCPTVSVSERPKTMFSFIHKSVQEFLAAVNTAVNFKTKIDPLNNLENEDLQREYIHFVNEALHNCSNVDKILEQSNFIIMLCGLEPRLATQLSKYIYDIVKGDPFFQIYRRTIDSSLDDDLSCIKDIQDLIFDSMEECNAYVENNFPTFYIGDLYIDLENGYCDFVCWGIDQQQIKPDFILSIFVEKINTFKAEVSQHLPMFNHLEKLSIGYSTDKLSGVEDQVKKYIAETIEINATTLKTLNLMDFHFSNVVHTNTFSSLCKEVVCSLSSMDNLKAIDMGVMKMCHADTTRFCEYLEGTSLLEQMRISIECDCLKEHAVNLSNHQQLQYLELLKGLYATDIDTVNLEVFNSRYINKTNHIKICDSIGKCDKLKKLHLDYNERKNDSKALHTSFTEGLVSLLKLLHNICEINLHSLRITDNIIKVPSNFRGLNLINLEFVTMSLTTWRKFVDSLPNITNTVHVRLFYCYITRDGGEFYDDTERIRLQIYRIQIDKDAKRYVKDKKQLFDVTMDDEHFFEFSTKSVIKDR